MCESPGWMLIKQADKIGRSEENYTFVRVHKQTHAALKTLAKEEEASMHQVIKALISRYENARSLEG